MKCSVEDNLIRKNNGRYRWRKEISLDEVEKTEFPYYVDFTNSRFSIYRAVRVAVVNDYVAEVDLKHDGRKHPLNLDFYQTVRKPRGLIKVDREIKRIYFSGVLNPKIVWQIAKYGINREDISL